MQILLLVLVIISFISLIYLILLLKEMRMFRLPQTDRPSHLLKWNGYSAEFDTIIYSLKDISKSLDKIERK